MSSTDPDIVIIGAGHNALVAACYLTLAGLSVLVLEANRSIGGATRTEELTLPGFKHDTFSTGHFAIQDNPILTDTRIDLAGRGLNYLITDPAFHMPLPGGESVTVWIDDARTAAEFARHNRQDGKAWLDLVSDASRLEEAHFNFVSHPPGQAPEASDAAKRVLSSVAEKSAFEVVEERFESEAARNVVLFLAAATGQVLSKPGTGVLALSLPYRWSRNGWPHAEGGAQALPDALASFVLEKGGRILCNKIVSEIEISGGRAVAVRTKCGSRFSANRAILSNMHIRTLRSVLDDAYLPDDFRLGADRFQLGHSVFVGQLALPVEPRFRSRNVGVNPVVGGTQSLRAMKKQFSDALGRGVATFDPELWFFGACHTHVDRTRAPIGRGIAKIMTIAPYHLEGDADNWGHIKEDYSSFLLERFEGLVDGYKVGDELALVSMSPKDIEAANPHLLNGSTQGGEMIPSQLGLNRPFKNWARYRMPVKGLYQTGVTTHPGSPVSGWPGRHASCAILDDLGYDAKKVVGPRRALN